MENTNRAFNGLKLCKSHWTNDKNPPSIPSGFELVLFASLVPIIGTQFQQFSNHSQGVPVEIGYQVHNFGSLYMEDDQHKHAMHLYNSRDIQHKKDVFYKSQYRPDVIYIGKIQGFGFGIKVEGT